VSGTEGRDGSLTSGHSFHSAVDHRFSRCVPAVSRGWWRGGGGPLVHAGRGLFSASAKVFAGCGTFHPRVKNSLLVR
jgi:hypothetical protein